MESKPDPDLQARNPSLLWPILELDDQGVRVLSEKPCFPDFIVVDIADPYFPYDPGIKEFHSARASCDIYLENSRFWQAFARTTRASFIDAYFYDDQAWILLLDMLDRIDRDTNDGPERIEIFLKVKTLEKAQGAISEELENRKLSKYDIRTYALPIYVHDRFALFDSSIWHCGASAGGCHPKMNAISGPWPDAGSKFRNFLDRLIQEPNQGL